MRGPSIVIREVLFSMELLIVFMFYDANLACLNGLNSNGKIVAVKTKNTSVEIH